MTDDVRKAVLGWMKATTTETHFSVPTLEQKFGITPEVYKALQSLERVPTTNGKYSGGYPYVTFEGCKPRSLEPLAKALKPEEKEFKAVYTSGVEVIDIYANDGSKVQKQSANTGHARTGSLTKYNEELAKYNEELAQYNKALTEAKALNNKVLIAFLEAATPVAPKPPINVERIKASVEAGLAQLKQAGVKFTIDDTTLVLE